MYLETECPELAQYGNRHPTFVDRPGWDALAPWNLPRRYLVILAAIGVIFGVERMMEGRGWIGILEGLLMAFVALMLTGAGYVLGAVAFAPRVSIDHGKVCVSRPLHVGRSCAALSHCTWYVGKAKDDTWLPPYLTQKVIIIEFPPGLIPTRRRRVACGWSEETRRVLEQFLALTAVTRDH